MNPPTNPRRDCHPGYTLVELMATLAVIALLAALLLPAVGRAGSAGAKVRCSSNLRQIGIAWQVYLADAADRFPDRRDLKSSLPGGFRPWTDWPRSDPRSGWAAMVLSPVLSTGRDWQCPGAQSGALARQEQAVQGVSFPGGREWRVQYWMWRFDRTDDPVPADNFWGKSVSEAVMSWRAAEPSLPGQDLGPAGVELVVDAYFPGTIPTVSPELRGKSAHPGGKNRLFLAGQVEFQKDRRLR